MQRRGGLAKAYNALPSVARIRKSMRSASHHNRGDVAPVLAQESAALLQAEVSDEMMSAITNVLTRLITRFDPLFYSISSFRNRRRCSVSLGKAVKLP